MKRFRQFQLTAADASSVYPANQFYKSIYPDCFKRFTAHTQRRVDEVFLSDQSKVLSDVWMFPYLRIILS
jgi:hypothetical protein